MASPLGTSLPASLLSSPSTLSRTSTLLPLLSTTASLSIAVWEYLTFSSLLTASKTDPVSIARTLSLYWRTALVPSLALILTLGTTSITSGIRLVRHLPLRSRERWLAIAGTLFAAGHFGFARAVAVRIERMARAYEELEGVEAEEEARAEVVEERVLGAQREWIGLHVWRSLVVDGPAVGCFLWLAVRGREMGR